MLSGTGPRVGCMPRRGMSDEMKEAADLRHAGRGLSLVRGGQKPGRLWGQKPGRLRIFLAETAQRAIRQQSTGPTEETDLKARPVSSGRGETPPRIPSCLRPSHPIRRLSLGGADILVCPEFTSRGVYSLRRAGSANPRFAATRGSALSPIASGASAAAPEGLRPFRAANATPNSDARPPPESHPTPGQSCTQRRPGSLYAVNIVSIVPTTDIQHVNYQLGRNTGTALDYFKSAPIRFSGCGGRFARTEIGCHPLGTISL